MKFGGLLYLKELAVGDNARYRSHAIIGEFLKVLAAVVEEQQFSDLKYSNFGGHYGKEKNFFFNELEVNVYCSVL